MLFVIEISNVFHLLVVVKLLAVFLCLKVKVENKKILKGIKKGSKE